MDLFYPVPSEVNYWLVRTESGSLYEPFSQNNCIAIKYPEITADFLKNYKGTPESLKKNIQNIVGKAHPDHKRSGLMVSHILNFTYHIKRGDYVVIPDQAASRILIGIVEDDFPFPIQFKISKSDDVDNYLPYNKARKVKWLKEVDKARLNPNLYGLFSCHMAITSANDYKDWINQLLYDMYLMDGKFHYVMKVNTNHNIKASALFISYSDLFKIVDQFLKDNGIEGSISNVDAKMNLNSPGSIVLFSCDPYFLGALSLILYSLLGGELSIKVKGFELKIGAKKGLIKLVTEFLNSMQDRKLKKEVVNQLKKLDIIEPKNIIEIIETINKKNQNEAD